MHYAYPASLREDEIGRIVVRFRDLPEALTDGADRAEALAEAADCLNAALLFRVKYGEAIPEPSQLRAGETLVAVEPAVALKAALHAAMRERTMTAADLARRLQIDHKEARRLLDPDHPTKLPRMTAALEALGRRVAVVVETA